MSQAKRLNKLPMAIGLTIFGIIVVVFLIGINGRLSANKARANEGDGNIASSDDHANRLIADGLNYKEPIKPIRDDRPVPVKKVVVENNTDFEKELEKIKFEARLDYERYKVQRASTERKVRDGMADAALSSISTVDAPELFEELRSSNNSSMNYSNQNATSSNNDQHMASLMEQLGGSIGQPPTGGNDQMAQLISSLNASGIGGMDGAAASRLPEQTAFINEGSKDDNWLPNKLQDQRSEFEVKQGTVIPGIMVTGINSDLPGRIIGQVSQNVYDTATGQYLLIPQGAKLFGRYDSGVTFGQSRVLVAWTRIIYPDGRAIDIDAMVGTDKSGYGGFKDKVDNHYDRLFGTAVALSVFGAGIDYIRDANGVEDPIARSIRQNFGETFEQVISQTIRKNMNRQPTLKIRPGYKFHILIDQDIVLTPYKDTRP